MDAPRFHVVKGTTPPESCGASESSEGDAAFVEILARSLDDLFLLACRLELNTDRALDLLQDGLLPAEWTLR